MDESEKQPADTAQGIPADPEERAFTGHPDHPPSTPDQPVEGNQELLRQGEDSADPQQRPGPAKA
ncbi:MAG TPA: hypothetical protein VF582_03625 [Allosphingosinicella sp.]|jgi:hypothetical protein